MSTETIIPALPCASIDETLAFYVVLGFEVTYQQTRPNTYACIKRGGIDLHFFSMRGYEPANSYSTCIVLTSDAEKLYQEFTAAIRQHYGKKLIAGIPRMTALRDKAGGSRGFNIIDPGGNWIRFSQPNTSPESGENSESAKLTKLSRATLAADLLADRKGDFPAAARMLDTALAQAQSKPVVDRIPALVLRAFIAISMNNESLARKLLTEIRAIPLTGDERSTLAADLERAADLEQAL